MSKKNITGLGLMILLCGLALLLLPSAAWALEALARKGTTLYSSPSLTAKPLGKLPRITRINVLGKRGEYWFKIRITLKNGSTLEGWTEKRNLMQSSPQARKSTASAPQTNAEEKKLVESLLTKRKPTKESPASKYRETSNEQALHWLEPQFDLGANIGYQVNSYSVADASNSISYDIPGLLFGVVGEFRPFHLRKARVDFGVRLEYNYELRNYTIEFLDDQSPANQISRSDASGTAHLFDGMLFGAWRFTPKAHSGSVQLGGGYRLSTSTMDDGEVRNLPVHLFTNHDYTHIYLGGGLRVPFQLSDTTFGFKALFRYFLVSDFSESTADGSTNVSGGSPEATTGGYSAEAGFFWSFTERFVAELLYLRRQEGADFTGAGSRLINTSQQVNFTDASVSETYNGARLGVSYQF